MAIIDREDTRPLLNTDELDDISYRYSGLSPDEVRRKLGNLLYKDVNLLTISERVRKTEENSSEKWQEDLPLEYVIGSGQEDFRLILKGSFSGFFTIAELVNVKNIGADSPEEELE